MISIFTLTLAANESREVAISGEYFELRNAVYPVALIELMDRSGGVVSRLDNPEQSDYVRPGRYETVRITNGATAQTIKHFYGSGDAGSRRTSGQVQVVGTVSTTGLVEVVDGGRSRVLAGVGFSGVAAQTALAGNYSYAQLFNPVASGKNMFIEQIAAQTGGAAGMIIGFQNAVTGALTGLVPQNKKAGGAVGVGKFYAGTSAAAIAGIYALLNGNIWTLKEPLLLPPGYSCFLRGNIVNQDVQAAFEFFEEPV